mmetsp:Transcript_14452/g.17253  ORF Transcript_14452/g.17253 Transcript_14452/m.17253 type:complete len:205 (-) Transcript_14452:217-831(-)
MILAMYFLKLLRKELEEERKALGHPHHDDKESCCGSTKIHPHKLGQGEYLQFKVRKENVEPYANNWIVTQRLLSLAPDDPKTPVYVFTASANGIMRYHPHPESADWRVKLWLGYLDSADLGDFAQNMAHAVKYGCFCFGIIYREKKNYVTSTGKHKKGGRTIIMRYNRWATHNLPMYAFVVQHHDNQDPSVPEQPSMCSSCSLL